MKRQQPDGRIFVPQLVALAQRDGETWIVRSPTVGLLRDVPPAGTVVGPGAILGALEILGVVHRLVAPAEVSGVVLPREGLRTARTPMAYGDPIVVLDPHAASPSASADADPSAPATTVGAALRFVSPLSGRYYARPSPDRPPFVSPGDTIARGQTIALLEVMKTFNRITYGGDALPERARVLSVLPRDEDDLDEGDPILELEPA